MEISVHSFPKDSIGQHTEGEVVGFTDINKNTTKGSPFPLITTRTSNIEQLADKFTNLELAQRQRNATVHGKPILRLLFPKPLYLYPKLKIEGQAVLNSNNEKLMETSQGRTRFFTQNNTSRKTFEVKKHGQLSRWKCDVLRLKVNSSDEYLNKRSDGKYPRGDLIVSGKRWSLEGRAHHGNMSYEDTRLASARGRTTPEQPQWADAFTKPTVRRLNHVLVGLCDPQVMKYRRRTKCSCLYHVI